MSTAAGASVETWEAFEAQLSFPCNGCHRLRPNRFIDVYKRTIRVKDRLTLTVHQNYCNDRPECLTAVIERVEAARRRWLDG